MSERGAREGPGVTGRAAGAAFRLARGSPSYLGSPSARVGGTVRWRRRRQADSHYAAQLERVWKIVADHFYARNMNGVNWQAVRDRYLEGLPAIRDDRQFDAYLNSMIAELHASHAAYADSDDVEFYMLPSVMEGDLRRRQTGTIGIMGDYAGDAYIVTGVMEGSVAEKAGLLPGDTILSADGRPFTSAGSFRGYEGREVRLQVRHAGAAAPVTVPVTPVRKNVLQEFLDATRASARTILVNGKRIGYAHLWTMAHPAFRDALDHIVTGKLHDTDGLILDLRDGYGGSPLGYADVFCRPDITLETRTRGQDTPTFEHSGYGKPLVVITDRGTRSAKEYLTYALKVSRRATIVGDRTAGAFLGAQVFQAGPDAIVELPVLNLKVDGERLEGRGVAPDIAVTDPDPERARTEQLARAEQILAGGQRTIVWR